MFDCLSVSFMTFMEFHSPAAHLPTVYFMLSSVKEKPPLDGQRVRAIVSKTRPRQNFPWCTVTWSDFSNSCAKRKAHPQKKHESLHLLMKLLFFLREWDFPPQLQGGLLKLSPAQNIRSHQARDWVRGDSHTNEQQGRKGTGKEEWKGRPEIQVRAPIPDPLWLKIILKNITRDLGKWCEWGLYLLF